MTEYYDVVLGLIPVSLAGLTAVLLFAGLSLSAAIPVASLATVGLMGHALFVNAPVSPSATVLGDDEETDSAAPSQSAPASGNRPAAD
jgi:hypothetical protein